MNKRIPEATALRNFFQEQWDYLQHLIEARQANRLRLQHEKQTLADAVETIVDATDVRLRAIGSYQKGLRASARGLLDYIEALVAQLPTPLKLSQSAYINDPMVNMLFKTPVEMHRLFSQTQSVRDFIKGSIDNPDDEVYALLFLNRTEKNIFGVEMQGEVILKEVQQTSISFSGHQLKAPNLTEDSARSSMKRVLFESVVQHLERQIAKIRRAQTEQEKLSALQNPQRNINNPEVYLKMLTQQMSLPKNLIRLQDSLVRVNSMGIKLPLDSGESTNAVRFYEVGIGEEQSKILTLVRYPKSELQSHPVAHIF